MLWTQKIQHNLLHYTKWAGCLGGGKGEGRCPSLRNIPHTAQGPALPDWAPPVSEKARMIPQGSGGGSRVGEDTLPWEESVQRDFSFSWTTCAASQRHCLEPSHSCWTTIQSTLFPRGRVHAGASRRTQHTSLLGHGPSHPSLRGPSAPSPPLPERRAAAPPTLARRATRDACAEDSRRRWALREV